MATHPHEQAPRWPGMVCPTCDHAYVGFRVCGNPACANNPNLSDDALETIAQRSEEYAAKVLADRRLHKAYAQSFKRSY